MRQIDKHINHALQKPSVNDIMKRGHQAVILDDELLPRMLSDDSEPPTAAVFTDSLPVSSVNHQSNSMFYFFLQDGKKRCKRAECPQLTCAVKVQDEGECCARCATNQSEDGNKEQVNSKPEVMISTTWRGRGSRGGGRGGHKRRRAGRKNHHSKQETSSTARPLQMDGID